MFSKKNRFTISFLGVFFSLTAHSTISKLSLGGIHSLAVDATGGFYVWGSNEAAQLGLERTFLVQSPRKHLGLNPVVLFSAKRDHSCLLSDNKVKCFGLNNCGQLGLGRADLNIGSDPSEPLAQLSPLDLQGEVPSQFILGSSHSCLLFDSGKLKCFGSNFYGELGIGSSVKQIGLKLEEVGIHLVATDLGKSKATSGCAGRNYTCIYFEEGNAKCFGHANRTGNGSTVSIGFKASEMGNNLKPIALGSGRKILELACADESACALLDSGEVKCWGTNRAGSLGLGLKEGVILGTKAEEMGDKLSSVSIEPGLKSIHIACGTRHCCAILENGAVKCWGGNSSGQLGLGDRKDRGINPEEMGTALSYIDLGKGYVATELWAGSVTTCARLNPLGNIKCWGGNQNGQLGTGKISVGFGATPNTMGISLPILKLETKE